MRKIIWSVVLLFLLLGCEDDDKNPTPDPAFVYFQVGEINPHHNDSFILALKKLMILHKLAK